MSVRGLVVALLCGVLGLGIGAAVAYAVQPRTTTAGSARPVTAVSPSVPIDTPTHEPYRHDIPWPRLQPGLPIPVTHTIRNDLAEWTYHVPEGWDAFWVCSVPATCPPGTFLDTPMTRKAMERASEIRFRPRGEPASGGFSLRVRILENTLVDVHQIVGTKITGFRDSSAVADFNVIHRDQRSVSFEYRDAASNYHRFNFFQWFAVPDQTNATLEMSVSGRRVDVPGLKSLFQRFADYAVGTTPAQRGSRVS